MRIDYAKTVTASIAAIFMFALVLYPERYIHSVSTGLNLYAVAVLPALFPFFFFTKVLTSLGISSPKALDKPMRLLYNSPPVGGYIFFMAILSGYPVGAKMLADFYESGAVTQEEAKRISAFTSTSGPLFIIGTVGVSMFASKTCGIVLLLSHYISALVNGLIYRNVKGKADKKTITTLPKKLGQGTNILSDSITDSILSVAIVGGYIAIFSMILDVLIDVKVIAFLSKGLTILLPENLSYGLTSSLVEITRGTKMLSELGYPPRLVTPIAAFGVTFGGLSVTLQSMTFLSRCKISPAYYLLTKLTQGIIAFAAASLLSFLL